jgi:hypothetical protein
MVKRLLMSSLLVLSACTTTAQPDHSEQYLLACYKGWYPITYFSTHKDFDSALRTSMPMSEEEIERTQFRNCGWISRDVIESLFKELDSGKESVWPFEPIK